MNAPTKDDLIGSGTVVVIVTYGRRIELLRRTVGGLSASEHVAHIIIVDNGCPEPVTQDALGSPHPVTIVRIDGNIGSAGGFSRGIATALKHADARYLAILDDDNLGSPGYLENLIALHREHGGTDDVAFCALRSDRPQYRALLHAPETPEYRPNSFLSFHVGTLPVRLWRKLAGGKAAKAAKASAVHLRRIYRAPYGGLFLTMAAARKAGPPRADFILYGDDHEYTRRLTSSGVTLFLTDHATVEDIDQSWNLVTNKGSRWIDAEAPQWRIYYAARNHHYLERTEPDANIMLTVNRLVLTARLTVEALVRHRSVAGALSALRPFSAAIADASAERLGFNKKYVLPGWNDAAARNTDYEQPESLSEK